MVINDWWCLFVHCLVWVPTLTKVRCKEQLGSCYRHLWLMWMLIIIVGDHSDIELSVLGIRKDISQMLGETRMIGLLIVENNALC